MLTYPFGKSLTEGEAREVAPGVLWMRLPLPLGVDHINVWVLADGDGWTIVDTGMRTPGSASHWEQAISAFLGARPVVRVLCTHMHRDHVGMAGWLAERFGCSLWMSQLEYLMSRLTANERRGAMTAEFLRFYRAAGWAPDLTEQHWSKLTHWHEGTHAPPDSYHRLRDGDCVGIGGREWRVIVGRGHSPEHVSLHCAELALLLSGDQVLPGISTNVSLQVMEPEADPLGEWIASLVRLKELVSDDVLVLPAHNAPFRGLHTRIDQLIGGYEGALSALAHRLVEPSRAVDLFPIIFRREVRCAHVPLATGETLAHLNCLRRRGLVTREFDADEVAWYRATPGA